MFALDTLEYLQKGGRIGKAQALMGTLLKFKPLLAIQDGEVVPVGRVRTKSKAIDSMLTVVSQKVPARGEAVRLAVTHAEAYEEAEQVGRETQGDIRHSPCLSRVSRSGRRHARRSRYGWSGRLCPPGCSQLAGLLW